MSIRAHRSPRQVFFALSVALILVIGAAACGSGGDSNDGAAQTTTSAPGTDSDPPEVDEWQTVVEAAKAEGSVTIYSTQPPALLEALAAGFEAEYGIEVEFFRGIATEVYPRLVAEQQSGNQVADVLVLDDENLLLDFLGQGGSFVPPLGPSLDEPEYDRAEHFRDGDYYVIGAAAFAFGWNTDLYPQGLDDYDDLLDPALADGKIGIIEPLNRSTADFYMFLEEEYGDGFLERLAAQRPRILANAITIGEALVSGEILATSWVLDRSVAKSEGLPVDSATGPVIWGNPFFGAVLGDAPNPNAGQLLIDFMLTRAGQELISSLFASVLPNIESASFEMSDVRRQDAAKLTPELVQEYIVKWNTIFGR